MFIGKKEEGAGKETKMDKGATKKVKRERRGHSSLVYLGMCQIQYYVKVNLFIANLFVTNCM